VAAWSLMRSALLEAAQGNAAATFRLFEEIARRYGAAREPILQETAAAALLRTGYLFAQLDDLEHALRTWEDLIRSFGAATSPALQLFVAQARFGRAQTLHRLQRLEEAVEAGRDFLDRYARTGRPALVQARARLRTELVLSLGPLRRYDEIRALCDSALHEESASDDSVVREALAATLVQAIEIFRLAEIPGDQLTFTEEYLRRFEDDSAQSPGTLATILLNRGVCLGTLHRPEEELLAFDEVIRRFADCDEPDAQRAVAMALANRGLRLLELDAPDDGLASLHQAWRQRGLLPERGRNLRAVLQSLGYDPDTLGFV
jgi:tetratricopeptide (TPR) repeat protein